MSVNFLRNGAIGELKQVATLATILANRQAFVAKISRHAGLKPSLTPDIACTHLRRRLGVVKD